ncbi:MAG TPA: hypothetical protein VEB20_17610 [Azospirillaceae bacterium]|nr:hypothetical protein [Azospirillaceae bacterium]
MLKTLKAFAFAAVATVGITLAGSANAGISIIGGTDTAIPGNNDFKTQLNTAGFDTLNMGGNLSFTTGTVKFYLLGSESDYRDGFKVNGTTLYQEAGSGGANDVAWQGLPGTYLGQYNVSGQNPLSLTFISSNPNGTTASVGSQAFGLIYDGPNKTGLTKVVFAFDDQINNQDDNHDDLLILAKFTPAVPELDTWMMMLVGFSLVGLQLRRRNSVSMSVA